MRALGAAADKASLLLVLLLGKKNVLSGAAAEYRLSAASLNGGHNDGGARNGVMTLPMCIPFVGGYFW